MIAVRLKIRQNGEIVQRLIIEATPDGINIRDESRCRLDASDTAGIDADVVHCHGCGADLDPHDIPCVADVLELDQQEVRKLKAWRERRIQGVSAAELGAILDKVTARLGNPLRVPGPCRRESDTLVIEVEDPNV